MKKDNDEYSCSFMDDAAPLGRWRRSAASINNIPCTTANMRRRRRGPRSVLAVLRRSHKRSSGAPSDVAVGESAAITSEIDSNNLQHLSIYSINIQCFLAREAVLYHYLSIHRPSFVCIQESWLDASYQEVALPGYHMLSRRDRADNANRGGVIVFVRIDIADHAVLIHKSENSERCWHYIHLDLCIIAFANWYRPPASGCDSISELRSELSNLCEDTLGILIVGDINIHHRKWLRHSNANTPEGEALQELCQDFGLKQCVDQPTRGEYLLDLVLSDMVCNTVVLPKVADHCATLTKLKFPTPRKIEIQREVWHYKGAAWQNLKCALNKMDWDKLKHGSVNSAVDYFVDLLYELCRAFIPHGVVPVKKQTHPWLTDECRAAIDRKHSSEGTETFEQSRDACSAVLKEAYREYIQELKNKIATLPKSDKRWWTLNRQLLNKQAKIGSIAPLRDSEGVWHTSDKDKADLLAQTFTSKNVLPEMLVEQFVDSPKHIQQEFIPIRTRRTETVLKSLDVAKATGNDKISARILRELADVLAIPVTILARRILQEACWPKKWKSHLIVALFKRGAPHDSNNYRGVHITPVLSKAIEKIIGDPLAKYLQQYGYGDHQWGFRKQCSARDLILVCVSNWILAICGGRKIGIYLGDITAAFDRVCKTMMMAKLFAAGVSDVFLRFLDSYLEPRIGHVVLAGAVSEAMVLADTIFQGTVLGPRLWNCFFRDIAEPCQYEGGEGTTFADDLNVIMKFWVAMPNDQIYIALQKTCDHVHHWGKRHRVTFDPKKEHMAVLHPLHGDGPDFKLLGCWFDAKLTMATNVDKLAFMLKPKIKAMLRLKSVYGLSNMIQQFETHIWGYYEHHNGSILHACDTTVNKLDRLQTHFLHELHIDPEPAFLEYNFAPSVLRRDIGLLGFIHKRVLGQCHVGVTNLLPFASVNVYHDKQLDNRAGEVTNRTMLFDKSLFNLVQVYNMLPQFVVDSNNIRSFQKLLTQFVRRRCADHDEEWYLSYRSCEQVWRLRQWMCE